MKFLICGLLFVLVIQMQARTLQYEPQNYGHYDAQDDTDSHYSMPPFRLLVSAKDINYDLNDGGRLIKASEIKYNNADIIAKLAPNDVAIFEGGKIGGSRHRYRVWTVGGPVANKKLIFRW